MTGKRDGDPDSVAAWAFSLLTMRANTPAGEWLPADFEQAYQDGWREVVDEVGESEANDEVVLDLVNMANLLLDELAELSGQPKAIWLTASRENYLNTGDSE